MKNIREELNEKNMEQVNGGTVGSNTYNTWDYNAVGIQVKTNLIYKDEFTLPDGTKTDMKGADDYFKQRYKIECEIGGYRIREISTGNVVFRFGSCKRLEK